MAPGSGFAHPEAKFRGTENENPIGDAHEARPHHDLEHSLTVLHAELLDNPVLPALLKLVLHQVRKQLIAEVVRTENKYVLHDVAPGIGRSKNKPSETGSTRTK